MNKTMYSDYLWFVCDILLSRMMLSFDHMLLSLQAHARGNGPAAHWQLQRQCPKVLVLIPVLIPILEYKEKKKKYKEEKRK